MDLVAYPDSKVLLSPWETWRMLCLGPKGIKDGKAFRMVESRVPFASRLLICDVKMADSQTEEEIFEQHPLILYNMRRGLSFLMSEDVFEARYNPPTLPPWEKQEVKAFHGPRSGVLVTYRKKTKPAEGAEEVKQKPEQKDKPFFAVSRKGLHKFFDATPASFVPGLVLPHKDNKINYMLYSAHRTLSEKGAVDIVATRKINGENAQISYLPALDCWVVASKNVSLCARTEADVKSFYRGYRTAQLYLVV